jgi:hypothetical protein
MPCINAGDVRKTLDTIEELVKLVEESLYHLRLDRAAKAYHERSLALLAKLEGEAS